MVSQMCKVCDTSETSSFPQFNDVQNLQRT